MAQCVGCGLMLQSRDPEQRGYAPLSSIGREGVVCRRCFRIRNYGEIETVKQNADDFTYYFSEIRKADCLIVYIVDLFDLGGSMIRDKQQSFRNKPIVLVGNKMDLFPRSVKKERVKTYLRSFAAKNGIKPLDVVLCSAEKRENIVQVAEAIRRHGKGKDVFVVGTTNVGKSTFMNQLLLILNNREDKMITASPYPGTTLDMIYIPWESGRELVDTPGFLRKDRLSEWLSPAELRVITPNKTIRPRGYQLEAGQTVFFGGLARMDITEGSQQPFVVYASNELYLHRTKCTNADHFQKTHLGTKLVPPMDTKSLPPWKEHVFHFSGKRKEDIVVSSLGWIACGKEKATISIWAPEGIQIETRLALI